jgi:hypothetical protein
MEEERSRVDAERVQEEERVRAETAERESRVRIRQQEEALAATRERDQLALDERRRREEEARLEGIKRAEVERVRNAAAERAAHETALMQRKHELELAAIRQTANVRAMRGALFATSALLFAVGAAFAWRELGVHPERVASAQAEHTRALGAERERASRAENELTKSEARRRELEREHDRLAAAPPVPSVAPSTLGGGRGGTAPRPQPPSGTNSKPGKPGGKPGPPCDEYDPINPCLADKRLR